MMDGIFNMKYSITRGGKSLYLLTRANHDLKTVSRENEVTILATKGNQISKS
jgi:hypothetical protein